jgi:phage I-like protein
VSRQVQVFGAPLERSAPGKAPTAFLVWPAGEVVTDLGTFRFTARSAVLLLADQASKQLKYPFDLNHWSMDPKAPSSSSCAVGWHAIDVREGALWAVDCEWSPEIRQGLERQPPAWRYYSPVFVADPETREITKYLGCALTNTPATHGVTDLAHAASVQRAVAALPPNADLDRRMGLSTPVQTVAFDAKTNTMTLGASAVHAAAAHRVSDSKRVDPTWLDQAKRTESATASRSETPEERERRRDDLDRRMGVGRYAADAPRGCESNGRIFQIGVTKGQ